MGFAGSGDSSGEDSMLVLQRGLSEGVTVTFGKVSMKLKVVECGRGGVRLGFEAPDSVRILRDELVGGSPAGVQGQRSMRAA